MQGQRSAAAELVDNAPAGHIQEPSFKGADGRVVFESRHVPGDREHRFLDDILRFGVGQAGFAGDAVDQFPIRIEELLPGGLVLPVL